MNGFREAGWRWPLWSWRNLAITAFVVALLLAALGRLTAEGAPRPDASQATAATSVARPAVPGSTPAPSASLGSATPEVVPVAGEAPEDVAVAFVKAWARPDAEVEEWRAACQALSTGTFASALEAVPSASVPASRVLGASEILERSSRRAVVRVPTDGGAVHVELERAAEGWLVAGIEPEGLSPSASGPVG